MNAIHLMAFSQHLDTKLRSAREHESRDKATRAVGTARPSPQSMLFGSPQQPSFNIRSTCSAATRHRFTAPSDSHLWSPPHGGAAACETCSRSDSAAGLSAAAAVQAKTHSSLGLRRSLLHATSTPFWKRNSRMPRPMRLSTGTVMSTGVASCTSRWKEPNGPATELVLSTGEYGASRCEMSPTSVIAEQLADLRAIPRTRQQQQQQQPAAVGESQGGGAVGLEVARRGGGAWRTLCMCRATQSPGSGRPDAGACPRRAGRFAGRRRASSRS